MKRFEIYDLNTDRTYEVSGDKTTSIDFVWRSQKHWFSSGALVKITDLTTGVSEIFTKE